MVAARRARLPGVEADDRQPPRAGFALHWAPGIGARQHRLRGIDRGQGVAFGPAFFLLVDELPADTTLDLLNRAA